jgi:serine/threonine-protein kinase
MTRLPIDSGLRHEIESIFDEAIELSPAERGPWLDARCSTDHRLRAEVDALIIAHERAEGLLERNIARAAERAVPDATRGRRIGAYRVIREIGRGGMGVVYLAERSDGQYQQRVAVKLLRASPDAEELRRRFVAERQILASLRHRAIAQLLDGGVTDGQLPFLVMEYVDGVPLTTYCDRQRLGIDARLRLFREVCSAVHYAHQNLIIHRDIKPGNILVSPDGSVKLLDFGIAKLLNPSLGSIDQPLTRTELRAMTPEYASPEQVRGEGLTTTSDVYALGVVLYELLCGRRPYTLVTGSLKELIDVVCTRQPERPSAAVSRATSTEMSNAPNAVTTDSVARARSVSPERLRSVLSGDLDAIVMMALRKEATDRYGSADLLWEDLQRYLDGLPVHAQRGSRAYRARKFLRRHRVESAAAALVAISLTVGAGVAVRQSAVAARERDRAERARADAEQNLRQSESVTGFLVDLFDVTTPVPGGGAITADELLRRGTTQLETLRGQPLIQARMLEAMARVHTAMGRYADARAELDQSLGIRTQRLGANHAEVAGTLLYLGDLHRRMGQYTLADSLTRQALAIRKSVLGPRHPATAEALAQLAGIVVYLSDVRSAEELSRTALEIRRASLEPSDPAVVASLDQHGRHLARLGRYAESEAELREAIALYRASGGAESSDAAFLQLRLAETVLVGRNDTVQSEALTRAALAATRASLGKDHPRTAWVMSDLAVLVSQRGNHEEAMQLARDGLEIHRRAFGTEHPELADIEGRLAVIYMRAGRLADAERTQREALQIAERTLGPNHTSYASALNTLGEVLFERGQFDEAVAARRRGIDVRRRLFPSGGTLYGLDLAGLARMYARKGNYAVADSLFQEAVESERRYLPDTHHVVRGIFALIAERYRLEGNLAEADRYTQLARPR